MTSETLKIEFLYNAIQDSVSTIRAVDTKLQIILGIYLVPFIFSEKLIDAVFFWNKNQDWNNLCIIQIITLILSGISFLLWFVGIVNSIIGIIAMFNPVKAIEGEQPNGSFFYVGKLVKNGLFHYKINAKLLDYMKRLPENENEIIKELAFEQMKLSFIRDVKIKLHRRAAYCAILWGISI
jgi:hypothetical protein